MQFFYVNISTVYLYYLYNEPTNAQSINNLLYCSLLHWFSITDDPELKEQNKENTKGKKYSHTNTKKEMDHIYLL